MSDRGQEMIENAIEAGAVMTPQLVSIPMLENLMGAKVDHAIFGEALSRFDAGYFSSFEEAVNDTLDQLMLFQTIAKGRADVARAKQGVERDA